MNNPPAFPIYHQPNTGFSFECVGGMTLRDYFAAKAMQGLLPDTNFVETARQAWIMADEMLKSREK